MKVGFLGLALFTLSACDSRNVDVAPYDPVTEASAPTVASLESSGYSLVDYYPVGCEISDCPDCACDAIGAQFLDQSEEPHDSYDDYEYVCPAIEGTELSDWKCRRQITDRI